MWSPPRPIIRDPGIREMAAEPRPGLPLPGGPGQAPVLSHEGRVDNRTGRLRPEQESVMNNEIRAGLVWSALLILLAVAGLVWLVPEYIKMPAKLQNPYLSPRLWPTIVLAITGLLGLGMALSSLFAARRDAGGVQCADGETPGTGRRQALYVLGCLGAMLACLLLAHPLGMPLAVMVCFLPLLWISGKRARPVGIAGLFLLPAMLYLFFFHVADVSIPLGIVFE